MDWEAEVLPLNYTRVAAILCAVTTAHNQIRVSPVVGAIGRFGSGELYQLFADVASVEHADERFGGILDTLGDGLTVA